MKIHIEIRPALRKPDLETPIELDSVEIFKNKKNQWILGFSSKNHKYLHVNYCISSSHINDERCEFGAACFDLETYETWWDAKLGIDWPEDTITLCLIPESKEEREELKGKAVALPQKWRYAVCIVPFNDFYD